MNATYQMRLCQESTFSSGRTSFTFTYFWDYFTPAPSLDVNSSLHVCTVLPLIDPSYPTLCKPDFWTSPCYSEQWVTICNCLIVIKWKMIMIITSRICHKNHSQKIRRSRELNFKFGLKIKRNVQNFIPTCKLQKRQHIYFAQFSMSQRPVFFALVVLLKTDNPFPYSILELLIRVVGIADCSLTRVKP